MKLRYQTGIIMIEVLVSIAVVAFGILGLAALQTYSLQAAKEAYTRAIASDLANDLIDRVRVLRCPTLYKTGSGQEAADTCQNYAEPVWGTVLPACTSSDTSIACTEYGYNGDDGNTVGTYPNRWTRLLAKNLPGGVAAICKDAVPDDDDGKPGGSACPNDANAPFVIKIWWTERSGKKDTGTGKFVNETRRFYTSFQ